MIPIPRRLRETLQYEAYGETLEVTLIRSRHYSREMRESVPPTYIAKVLGQRRARFGDSSQIREDIQFFLDQGNLPYSKAATWR